MLTAMYCIVDLPQSGQHPGPFLLYFEIGSCQVAQTDLEVGPLPQPLQELGLQMCATTLCTSLFP